MTKTSPKKRALFAALVLLIVFGAAELILRIHDFSFYTNFGADLLGLQVLDLNATRRVMNRTVEFDPWLFWRFKPNQVLSAPGVYLSPVHINSRGFRGPEFSEPKPPLTYRVACLGDSSTFGWSVSDAETFPARLQALLAAKCPRATIEVLNLGVTGYTSLQGRELMTRDVAAWKPDLVVFAFGPNDRLPALKSDAEHLADRTWDIGPVTVFLNRFQVYKLLRAGAVYLQNRARGLSLDPQTYIPRLQRKVSPEAYEANARAVKLACDRIGADLVLVAVDYPSLPSDLVDRELRQAAANAGTTMPANWPAWDSREVVTRTADDLKVPCLDLRELFTENLARIQNRELSPDRAETMRKKLGDALAAEPWRFLMVDNGHPDAWGHELIAAALADDIIARPAFKTICGEDTP